MAIEANLLLPLRHQWVDPPNRIVGLFTDLTLYAEALSLAAEQGAMTVDSLRSELSPRLQKMAFVSSQGKRTVTDLVRELHTFGWLNILSKNENAIKSASYGISDKGQQALQLSKRDETAFLRLLAVKMHEAYVIPGWFIARLWDINPNGGEVIVPTPLFDWRPSSEEWENGDWGDELRYQTLRAAKSVRHVSPCAFPIRDSDWLREVEKAWVRLSTLQPRVKAHNVRYSPRRRLALAMREASVSMLFGSKPYDSHGPDFSGRRSPIHPRTYMGWCPRLEALELIFYTDWHPLISGRLLFPTSVFRETANKERFEPIRAITNPEQATLWLHQPQWDVTRNLFLETLISVHAAVAKQVGAMYVSLLDVRDEVCRQLRISSLVFDRFLELGMRELPSSDFSWSISVETDIRAEQSSRVGQLRRPVYLSKVPHSLIALAHITGN